MDYENLKKTRRLLRNNSNTI